MIVKITDDFNLDKIAQSGQCFRWTKQDDHSYRIIAGKHCLYITPQQNDCYELECTEDDYDHFWLSYFDLREDYRSIRGRIPQDRDPFLRRAAECEKGIRILRQDPWEMLITFIISQNRNIPAIRSSVELLAERCGERRKDPRGLEYYSFPEPAAILSLSRDELLACKLGYRWKYVLAAAAAVADGTIDLNQLVAADEESTMASLTGIFGVGVKVANCISLFGLHHLNAFPVDTWIKRILAQEYPEGYPYESYSPYNGVYQQYMFAYYRHRSKEAVTIVNATPEQYRAVREFYYAVIDGVGDSDDSVGWKKDIYPAPDFLHDSICNGELLVAEDQGTIVGAMVLNHQYNEEYRKIQWPTRAEDSEVTVIHALGIRPSHRGKGYAKQLVHFAVDHARKHQQKVIRIDVLKGNKSAKKLYTGMGFRYIHTLPMFYEDTGWTEFDLYEYPLYESADTSPDSVP